MPELPEVELAAERLRRVASGHRITAVRVRHPALRRAFGRGDVARVIGARIERVERRAKFQLLHLDSGDTLIAHFRMSGDWHLDEAGASLPRFARAVIELDNGARIVLDDPRALSSLRVVATAAMPLPALGPDPLSRAFTPRALAARLARRSGPVKPALLDQSVAAGVGNIYASEALWRARVHPETPGRELPPDAVRALTAAIRTVLRRALARAQRYRRSSTGAEARFDVYDREGEPCRRCGTAIRRIVQAGRSTYFCPGCQRI